MNGSLYIKPPPNTIFLASQNTIAKKGLAAYIKHAENHGTSTTLGRYSSGQRGQTVNLLA